jgi:hypothetical protein
VVVDELDTLPDSVFYGLERIGEGMKETFIGGQAFDIGRGHERTDELVVMAERGKSEQYLWLVDEAEDRFSAATEKARDAKGFKTAEEAVIKHLEVLERVRENVPDVAKIAISMAILRSSRGVEVIADLKAGVLPVGEAKGRLEAIKDLVEDLREAAEDNLGMGYPIREIVRNIERKCFDDLLAELEEVEPEDFDDYAEVLPLIQNRIDSIPSAVENAEDVGLEIAKEAILKHLEVLQRVYENVSEVAKAAISLAMGRSAKCIEVISGVEAGRLAPDTVRRELMDRREKAMELWKEVKENIERGVSEVEVTLTITVEVSIEIAETIEEIAEELDENVLPDLLTIQLDTIADAAKEQPDMQRARQGLEQAKQASLQVQTILQGVLDRVPEEARAAIERASEKCQIHIDVLSNLLSGILAGEITEVSELLQRYENKYTEARENFIEVYGEEAWRPWGIR